MIDNENKLNIITFGNPNEEVENLNIPVISMGYIHDDKKLVEVYSAADFVILPSLEDNLPNIILEAMGCGTPVIGFEIGGLPDIITDDVGKIVKAFDTKALTDEIKNHILNLKMLKLKQELSRKKIEANYKLKDQAESYLKLFHEISDNKSEKQSFNKNKYFIKSKIFPSNLSKLLKISIFEICISILKKIYWKIKKKKNR